ncbi:MAG TPA: error-prone DNA polymerase [Caldilineaceae bacterium]|nr:error-prone DNA polymerase [Caldilineaceae bacterium]
MTSAPSYAELHCHSYYSLLDAASSPEALVEAAQRLGLRALALTDHDSLAGAVRFWTAARRAELHPILGAEVTLADGHHLTLLAETQSGYSNLCRLITTSRLDHLSDAPDTWLGKSAPALTWERLAQHTAGLICMTGCRQGPVAAPLRQGDKEQARRNLHRLYDLFGRDHLFVELQRHQRAGDDRLIRQLCDLAYALALPIVATNNVHHATVEGGPLRDALIAVRHHMTLTEARQAGLLPDNRCAALASPQAMARRFAERPDALENSVAIAERCQVSLDFSNRRLPTFPTPPGISEYAYLYELCHAALPRRYPQLHRQVINQLAHELDIIDKAGLAGYFLIVWDIVREARARGIRCQGRGSAANSIVAYLLAITSIDPLAHDLLFERFLSEDKFTPPDIDLDFAADRREEIIQYVYGRYGADHTAMVANTVTYQARSGLRDLAKALGFPLPLIDKLAQRLDTHSCQAAADALMTQVEDASAHHPLRLLAELLRQIDGVPRHLGIHSGGMLITGPPLAEVVPLEPATMPGRVVVQWDKDSVEDAGLIKIDLLGLRMLGLISEAAAQIERRTGAAPNLDALPLDDPAIYAGLQRGDTIGAFQVESRAQQQMLPRLKPECFEDIIVAIAIIRPGPIQGNMVHPYLRRRAGLEGVSYPHSALAPVLAETLGVLLFQEQVLRAAVALAGFAAGEADMLRRALSRSRPGPEIDKLRARFIAGALKQGIAAEEAGAVFAQLAGYAGYGFCKSHSASFALIAYQSLWLKHYYPAEFYCALLNMQPMGFYSPEVILGDARRHGLAVLPPDINLSQWRYTVENGALRTGLAAVSGLGESGYARIAEARQQGPFTDLRDLLHRTCLPKRLIANLIRAGALDGIGSRRALLWALGPLDERSDGLDVSAPLVEAALPPLGALEQTLWEYELLGHSPDGQLLRHDRAALREAGILSTWQVKQEARAGQRIRVAGMVVVRQRPQTAKGILFLSLEDEAGLLDLVVKPDVYPQARPALQETPLIVAEGVVQRAEGAVSVLVGRLYPLR